MDSTLPTHPTQPLQDVPQNISALATKAVASTSLRMHDYLDRAVKVLEQWYSGSRQNEESRLAELLQDAVSVDEAKVLALGKVLKYMSAFNDLVRENLSDMHFSDRYNKIREDLSSMVKDMKMMIEHEKDGKVDLGEKIQQFFAKMQRGPIQHRLDEIRETYERVAEDTKKQIDKERVIADAYIDFRQAVKGGEVLAYELLEIQRKILAQAEDELRVFDEKVKSYAGPEGSEKSKLEMDLADYRRKFDDEKRIETLLTRVAENIKVSHNTEDVLVAEMNQTSGIKEQVYVTLVTFYTTNEHVITTLAVSYTQHRGLHETTETLNALKEEENKAIAALADLGTEVKREAVKAAYSATIEPETLQKFVDSMVNFEVEMQKSIVEYNKKRAEKVEKVAEIVQDGLRRAYEARYEFLQQKAA